MSISNVSINYNNNTLKFTVDETQTNYEISFVRVYYYQSIHIEFTTKNLSNNRKKITSKLLYELKHNDDFVAYIRNISCKAIKDIYKEVTFSPDDNLWTQNVVSYYCGCKIAFTIATTNKMSVNDICNRFNDFLDNCYLISKNGCCYND